MSSIEPTGDKGCAERSDDRERRHHYRTQGCGESKLKDKEVNNEAMMAGYRGGMAHRFITYSIHGLICVKC